MNPRSVRLLKIPVFIACLLPLAKLSLEAFGLAGLSLGANPIEELIHRCGLWGLNFLYITLTVTPLRRISGWNWLIRFRRMFGLFSFFYLCLHFTTYAGLDQRFDFMAIGEDILKRPYITLGITGLTLLIPLAITSTAGMMRRLGHRWQQLHRLIYLVAILGTVHFYWQVKKDVFDPLIYAGILALLLGFRLVVYWRKKQRTAPRKERPVATCAIGPTRE
jgi:sulfoxide reductase heme-binding subunit YedZ